MTNARQDQGKVVASYYGLYSFVECAPNDAYLLFFILLCPQPRPRWPTVVWEMIHGISNPSGTGCHLSAALIVLAEGLSPIRRGLRLVRANTTLFLRSLGDFLDEYSTRSAVPVVNPTNLYDAIRETLRIEVNELGDAVTAMMKLLQVIRDDDRLKPLMESTVDGGQVHSFLMREKQVGDKRVRRWKETKVSSMPCPFPLSTCSYSSLQEALQAALEPHVVGEYRWNGQFREQEIPATDQEHDWLNTRRLCVDNVPNYWLLHLDRFRHTDKGTEPVAKVFTIPTRLDHSMLKDHTIDHDLKTAILHVHSLEEENDDDAQEGGHYCCACRTTDGWYLVDDDRVSKISESRCLELLSGSTESGLYMMGVLLLYESTRAAAAIEQELDALQKLTSSPIDWSRPELLVGRRLRVQWAMGKSYEGKVVDYHAYSGKHKVLYDDGDVREYRLAKKSIEWI